MRNDELETLIKQSITANIKPEASIKRGPKAEVPLSRKRYGKGAVSCFIHILVVIPFLEDCPLFGGGSKYTTVHHYRQPIPAEPSCLGIEVGRWSHREEQGTTFEALFWGEESTGTRYHGVFRSSLCEKSTVTVFPVSSGLLKRTSLPRQ